MKNILLLFATSASLAVGLSYSLANGFPRAR